jgi:threonine dehydrogenase-like Zn-dependent dehydrogenase
MERLSLEVVARVPEESLATGASLIIAQDLLSSRQATAKRLEADLVVDAKMSFGERLKQASGTARGVGSDGAIEAAGPRRPSRKPSLRGKSHPETMERAEGSRDGGPSPPGL